jgi:geranylgeranyl reductase family protein
LDGIGSVAVPAASCDVLIVGAGPAGSHLGYLLARRGYEVAIVEKCCMPRDKVCGGGLTRKAVRLLDADLGAVVHHWVHAAQLRFRGDPGVVKHLDPPPACTVLRREFDLFLLERARAAGARCRTGVRFVDARGESDGVQVRLEGGGALRCRLLVGSDGAASAVRARFFGRRLVRCVPALETLVPMSEAARAQFGTQALFDFGAIPHGYGWIFPKRDHLNVGVYSPLGGRGLRRHLQGFLARYEALAGARDAPYQGFAIPIRNAGGRFQADRVWLLGDAAGLADGLFGEGIYFALKSAELAARAVQETGLRPNAPRYTQLLESELLPELRASRWLGRAVYAFPSLAYRRIVRNERANEDFAGLLSGSVGYRECLGRVIRRAPRWLLARAPG